jgi:WD40 repeat protein
MREESLAWHSRIPGRRPRHRVAVPAVPVMAVTVVIVALIAAGCAAAAKHGTGTGHPARARHAVTAHTAAPGSPAVTPFATLTDPAAASGVTASAEAVSFSPAGTVLAGAEDGSAYLWDAATSHIIDTLAPPGSDNTLEAMALSRSGTTLAVGGGDSTGLGVTWLWDVATSRLIATLPPAPGAAPGIAVASVAFSPDGVTLAVANQDGKICLWKAATRSLIATLSDPEGTASGVAFSPSGRTLAVADRDGATLWDVATGRITATLHDPQRRPASAPQPVTLGTWSLAFSPSGTTLALADGDGDVYLWDVASSRLLGTLTAPGQGGTTTANSVAFSPSGTTLATNGGPGAYLWDLSTRRVAQTFSDPDSIAPEVNALAWSPDGKNLAAADQDGSVYLWHAG